MSAALRVVIAGRGVVGAMAAAALARSLPTERYSITVVGTRDDENGLGGFGGSVAALPAVRAFHQRLGLGEEMLVAAEVASFSLGSAFSGWSPQAPTYFAPFGDIGAPLAGVPFHQIVARLRAAGHELRLADFSMAAMMAQAGRFAQPSNDARTPLSTIDYGVHLDVARYAEALRAVAAAAGAHLHPGVAADSVQSDGVIAALLLEDGTKVKGDFFIDASGAAGLVIGAAGGGWQSWRRWLPCDRSLCAMQPGAAPPAPYAHISARRAGWQCTIPGPLLVADAMVYASAWLSDDEAAQQFDVAPAVVAHRFEAGRRALPWSANCVAIGAAAAVVEPTGPSPLDLARSAIERLLDLFPTRSGMAIEAREYNRLAQAELDRARDFAILRYKLNGRVGEPLWDQLRESAVPAEVEAKLALYQSRGRVPLLDGDRLEESDFAILFDAHGVRARRYDALADALPVAEIREQLSRMRQLMLQAVAPLPMHGDYLGHVRRRSAA